MCNNHLAHALLTGPLADIVQLWVLPKYDDSARGLVQVSEVVCSRLRYKASQLLSTLPAR